MDKTRILIVDDDVNLSRLVSLMLEKTKLYETSVENRPRHAVAAVRAFSPHLILLDVDMPGMDGGAVARGIRGDEGLKNTPIIFFTSLLSRREGGNELVLRNGDHFLAKPVDPLALIECIDSVLMGAAVERA